jgi:hypothetical protein
MSYKPSDPYSKEFTTASPTTGAAANADSLPVATADFDGSGTGSMALTVANLDTGRYKATGTFPAGRVRGDVLNVSVAATVGGVAGKAVVDTQVLDSKRVGDLNDAVTPPTATAIATAVWTDATPSDFTAIGSAGNVLVAQLGGAFVTVGSSVFTAAALANAEGVVWNALKSNHTTAGSFGLFVDAAVSTRSTYAGGAVASVTAPVTLTTGERDAVASALLALTDGVETGETVRQLLRLVRAVLLGVATDTGTTAVFKRKDGTTTALTVVHDTAGNRTSSTVGTV